jgi:hypothetical protein
VLVLEKSLATRDAERPGASQLRAAGGKVDAAPGARPIQFLLVEEQLRED